MGDRALSTQTQWCRGAAGRAPRRLANGGKPSAIEWSAGQAWAPGCSGSSRARKGVEVVTLREESERCSCCGVPVAVTVHPITIGDRTIVFRRRVCAACDAAAATSESNNTAPPKSKWQRLCPPLYQRDLP